MLVAIAIPVFTSQLEKSRESTDAANIRAAYAEIMVKAIDGQSSIEAIDVPLVQQEDGWINGDLKTGLVHVFNADSNADSNLDGVGRGKKATLTWNEGNTSTDGYVSIAVADA